MLSSISMPWSPMQVEGRYLPRQHLKVWIFIGVVRLAFDLVGVLRR